MEKFYLTNHTGHEQQPPFPPDPPPSSGSCNAKSCVPKQGSRPVPPNPTQSPCPSPPPCFPKKLVQPQGFILVDDLLPSGWRQTGWGAESAPSHCPQALLCPGAGISAPAPAWGSKDLSSHQWVCSETLKLGAGLQMPHSCTATVSVATPLRSGLESCQM